MGHANAKTITFAGTSGLIASLLLLAACSTTKVLNEWRNPDVAGVRFGHLVVAALFKQDQTRRLVENEFAQQLSSLGLMVTRSYILVPRLDENTAGQLARLATAVGADGFMIIRMPAGKQSAGAEALNQPPAARTLAEFLQKSWPDNYQPSSPMTNAVMLVESRLYDANTGKLIWSLRTENKNRFGLKWEINLLGKLALEKMKKLN